ncbi:hypothetical protein EVAR_93896_1 [Eumeta japonica]|uniref:Uncharacterized protein n=1 Tax=Eumeta variegata TaxID=151549 RepID=A0A4C1TWR1_EUMVA|nr:hypothetical protein EVAR_93896_1 [Eumeta japonica]
MPTVLDVPPRDYIFTATLSSPPNPRPMAHPLATPTVKHLPFAATCCRHGRDPRHIYWPGTHDAVAADDSENRDAFRGFAAYPWRALRHCPLLSNSKLVASAPPA